MRTSTVTAVLCLVFLWFGIRTAVTTIGLRADSAFAESEPEVSAKDLAEGVGYLKDLEAHGVKISRPPRSVAQARLWAQNADLLGLAAHNGTTNVRDAVAVGSKEAAEILDQVLWEEHRHLYDCKGLVSKYELTLLLEFHRLKVLVEFLGQELVSSSWARQMACAEAQIQALLQQVQ
jgi:hypothetical protein